ncbi:hypothetical protein U9M48_043747 [Paspalum notatum var. saurae]|uniref:Retrovirus-related Pol polyprotein from transposon TNT 1-94-like beta-barrel domain-containing protein n=1 Tax=Paspalum notatum var. saurae TaxID=547442 RepID=A0AAQ3UXT4_PASNO
MDLRHRHFQPHDRFAHRLLRPRHGHRWNCAIRRWLGCSNEGCGTVLFDCKNGEHRAFPNTYFIPRLTANIINCGQLDEDDFEILIRHGFMRVRDEQGRLLAKICRGPG